MSDEEKTPPPKPLVRITLEDRAALFITGMGNRNTFTSEEAQFAPSPEWPECVHILVPLEPDKHGPRAYIAVVPMRDVRRIEVVNAREQRVLRTPPGVIIGKG